jgi:hypothetical protein
MELKEKWKQILIYPYYQASNKGNIRSLDKWIESRGIWKRGKILSKHVSSRGYYQVGLTINGKTKTVKCSILVCLAWHKNPLNKKVVNHKDTNKLNDCEWNLEWNTQKENVEHAIRNKCRKSFALSKETIKKIVEKTSKPVIVLNKQTGQQTKEKSITAASLTLGVSQSAISYSIKRKTVIKNIYTVSIDRTTLTINK